MDIMTAVSVVVLSLMTATGTFLLGWGQGYETRRGEENQRREAEGRYSR